MKELKIVVLGGGSSYTPELVEGIIQKRATLPVTELVLVDIEAGQSKVAINHALVSRMFEKAKMQTKVSHTLDRKIALEGADYIMAQLRVGGLEARAHDEEIPIKYHMVGQETTGLGGFFKALRTIPVMMDICADIEAICPEAWLINFTNPSGIVTEVINNQTNVRCIGLCNVPINMHYDAAKRLDVLPEEIECNFIGLNHLSFMNKCTHKGEDVLDRVLSDGVGMGESLVKNIEKIDDEAILARKMGLMLSPYMQYFYFETEMIAKELKSIASGEGSRAKQVMKVEAELFELYKDINLKTKPEALSLRGGAKYSEAAISLINSLHNNIGDTQVVNVINGDSISDLPENCCVEVNCKITSEGPIPVHNGHLPLQVVGLIQQVKVYETYAIEAALTGDRDLALMAMINNPFIKSATDARLAFEELVHVHRAYLPLFDQRKEAL